MTTLQTLKQQLSCSPRAVRPVQIIHHRYPKTNTETAAYLDQAIQYGLGGFVVNMDCLPLRRDGETDEAYHLRRLDGYLGEGTPETEIAWAQFKAFVDACLERGLEVWIYDELAYPSGAAGNKVLVDHPEYQVKGIACATAVVDGGVGAVDGDTGTLLCAAAYPLLADDVLDTAHPYPVIEQDGKLHYDLPQGRYRVCGVYAKPIDYLTENGVPYTDLLRADAVKRFIDVTLEVYRKRLGDETLRQITAIFTDEPGLATHGCSRFFNEQYAVAAWTEELLDLLPDFGDCYVDLFFDTDRDFAAARRTYWGQVRRLFAENYFAQIAAWCEQHGTKLTGHLYGEETLSMQIGLNAGMFGLLKHMQMPGVDRLYCTDPRDVTAEKTASSAAHLNGRKRVMTENSFHLERVFWNIPDQSNQKRINSAFYQLQLGVTDVASYFAYDDSRYGFDAQLDPDRLTFEEYVGRASQFCQTGTHRADVLVLIPTDAAFERYTAQDHKYWDVGPIEVSANHTDSMKSLETVYSTTLKRLQDERFDYDLIDTEGLQACTVNGATLATSTETFTHLVVFDTGYLSEETQAKITAFLQNGGTVTMINTDRPTVACRALAETYPTRVRFADHTDVCQAVAESGVAPTLSMTGDGTVRVRKTETADAELWFAHNRGDACEMTVRERGRFVRMSPAWTDDGVIVESDGAFRLKMAAGEAVFLVREKEICKI